LPLKSVSIFAIILGVVASVHVAIAATSNEPCGLPEELQREITTKYPERKVVTLSDLNDDDKGFFRADHGDNCPGLVQVDFYGDGKPTLGLVLIGKNEAKEKASLLVAHQVGGHWKTKLLDTAAGPSVPVVWSQPPGVYKDVYGKKEIRATTPVIVLAGYEAWAIVYAWTGKAVAKVWISD
jgi:hypothetical protein